MNFERKIIALLTLLLVIFGVSKAQNNSPFTHFGQPEGLKNNIVYSLIIGDNGTIRAASGNSIMKFNGFSFDNEIAIDTTVVRLFYFKNNLYVSDIVGNIYQIDKNKATSKHSLLSDKENFPIINNIYSSDSILISCILPLKNITIKNNVVSNYNLPGIKSHFIEIIGTNLFCGSTTMEQTNSLSLIDNNKIHSFMLSKPSTPSFSMATRLNDGSILYAKDFELINIKDNKIISRSFVESNIQYLFQDSKSQIWVGLYNGIVCYPNGKIDEDNAIRYLKNHSISSILEDKEGYLWIATMTDGLFSFALQVQPNYTSPSIFTKNSNIAEIIQSTASSTSRIDEIRSSNNNLIKLNEEYLDTLPPQIYLNRIMIMGNDTTILSEYDLPYDLNFITVEYVGLAQGTANKIRYRYRLKGLANGKWTYTNNISAQYTTLPPGNYEFNVQAVNNNGVWSENYARFSFIINPPYWKTRWFSITSTTLIILILLFSAYLYSSTVKRKEKEKADIQQKMNMLELEGLRSQMNPHFLFNTLNSIQYFITQNDNKSAINYLSKFAKLMRKILDNSRKNKIPIKDEIEAIELYLILEQLRFENKLEYSLSIDESVDETKDEIPSMLIQPYIENAILHGILHKEEKGAVSIAIKKQDNKIYCVIEDNGVGRKKAQEIESQKIKSHQSSGMQITNDRLSILNQKLQTESSVKIIDLLENNIAKGTRVEIIIPL